MDPRGSVTFARDALGLLLARIPKDRPALSSGLPIRGIRGRYRRKQNLFVEGLLPVLLSPTEQDPAAAGPPHTSVRRRYIYLGFRGDGLVGPQRFPLYMEGHAYPIRMPWMPYSKCTKRSSRLGMTLWQVRDCLIIRKIK